MKRATSFAISLQALAVFFVASASLYPHNDDVVHSGLAVDSINSLNDPFISAHASDIRQGAIDEDLYQSCDHSYNPVTGTGWDCPLDSIGCDPATPSTAYVAILNRWNQAVQKYKAGNWNGSQGAFNYLGRTLHLLQDMTCPAHVLGDCHSYINQSGDCDCDDTDEVDDFECWLRNFRNQTATPYLKPTWTCQQFLRDAALFTYNLATYEGVLTLTNPQPPSELSSMFPGLYYSDGGIGGDGYWVIPNVGEFGSDLPGEDDWWNLPGDCEPPVEPVVYDCRFYIENAGGNTGLYCRVVPETWQGEPNTQNKSLLEFYGSALWTKAREHGAGLLNLFEMTVCPTLWYRDRDGDGCGDRSASRQSCDQPAGYVANKDDCNDNDPEVGCQSEVCDGKDNDCDGSIDDGLSTDADGDHHYELGSCKQPADDCDDNDAAVYPGAKEKCDGRDNDCNPETPELLPPRWCRDMDGDEFGDCGGESIEACVAPPGFGKCDPCDCDDADDRTFPGADEPCGLTDRNCDGRLTLPPPPPEEVAYRAAAFEGDVVAVEWTCVPGAESYLVQRKLPGGIWDPDPALVTGGNQCSWQACVDAPGSWAFRVVARNKCGDSPPREGPEVEVAPAPLIAYWPLDGCKAVASYPDCRSGTSAVALASGRVVGTLGCSADRFAKPLACLELTGGGHVAGGNLGIPEGDWCFSFWARPDGCRVQGDSLIIDDGDPGTSSSGSWWETDASKDNEDDSHYSNVDGATYTFETNLDGESELWIWWAAKDDRCTSVPVQVLDGETLLATEHFNQRSGGGEWHGLGSHTFHGSAKVRIISQEGCTTCADAVKFVRADIEGADGEAVMAALHGNGSPLEILWDGRTSCVAARRGERREAAGVLPGEWHHVLVRSSGEGISLSVDGEAAGLPLVDPDPPGGDFTFGANAEGGLRFCGLLDEVLYERGGPPGNALFQRVLQGGPSLYVLPGEPVDQTVMPGNDFEAFRVRLKTGLLRGGGNFTLKGLCVDLRDGEGGALPAADPLPALLEPRGLWRCDGAVEVRLGELELAAAGSCRYVLESPVALPSGSEICLAARFHVPPEPLERTVRLGIASFSDMEVTCGEGQVFVAGRRLPGQPAVEGDKVIISQCPGLSVQAEECRCEATEAFECRLQIAGGTLPYRVEAVPPWPAWALLDEASHAIFGRPPEDAVGAHTLKVRVCDACDARLACVETESLVVVEPRGGVSLSWPLDVPVFRSLTALVSGGGLSSDVELNLGLRYDEKGGVACLGGCSASGDEVSLSGRARKQGEAWLYDLRVKGVGFPRMARISGRRGSGEALVVYGGPEGKARGSFPVTLVEDGFPGAAGVTLFLDGSDARGKFWGTGRIVTGLGNDGPGAALVKGSLKRSKAGQDLSFTVSRGRQTVSFRGRRAADAPEGADFVGLLKYVLLPAKGTLRDFRVSAGDFLRLGFDSASR